MPNCVWCDQPLPKYRRKYCSEKCNDKYFAYILHPTLWGPARIVALEEANYKCEECGATVDLEVHHIEPLEHLEERNDSPKNIQSNLKALCRDCHKKAHILLRFKKKNPNQSVMEFSYG